MLHGPMFDQFDYDDIHCEGSEEEVNLHYPYSLCDNRKIEESEDSEEDHTAYNMMFLASGTCAPTYFHENVLSKLKSKKQLKSELSMAIIEINKFSMITEFNVKK